MHTKSDEKIGLTDGFLYRLQTKWGVKNAWQVLMILLTFTLTGSTVVYLRRWLFVWLGYTNDTSLLLKAVTYVLFIFPAYQLLILVFGTMLGQFAFFWQKEKKLYYFMKAKLGIR